MTSAHPRVAQRSLKRKSLHGLIGGGLGIGKAKAWKRPPATFSSGIHRQAYTTIGDERKNNHRRHLPLLFSTSSPRLRYNLLDHRGLGISRLLLVLPVLASKLPFGALVQLAIGCVAAQPVAEEQHAVDLRAARREDMEVDIRVRPIEHAVLVPVRLSDAQHIGGSLHGRNVSRLVCRVRYHKQHVDSRFGSKPWHRGRANVFDQHDPVAERSLDSLGLALEELGPLGVVVDDVDSPAQCPYLPTMPTHTLLITHPHPPPRPHPP